MTDPVDLLADRLGIAPAYRDQQGQIHVVSNTTKRALLAAFGVRLEGASDAERVLGELNRADGLVEPVVVLREDARPYQVPIALSDAHSNAQLRWRLKREGGLAEEHSAPADALPAAGEGQTADTHRRLLPLPADLPTGYHVLDIQCDSRGEAVTGRSTIIVVPRRAFRPPLMEQGARLWGVSVQLYGLRSSRNWGIGDFTDLRELMEWAGHVGAAAVGVNPLHALFLDDPGHISPYSPSSRYFLNPLYIDIEAIEEFATTPDAQALVAAPGFQHELARLREAELVDYGAVTALKRPVLELLHRAFRDRPESDARRVEFRRFCESRQPALGRFITFQALREFLGKTDTLLRDWRRWPLEFRDPRSPAVTEFARSHAEQVEFFAYLQWQAEIQLTRCVETAHRRRMPIGLYLDLAVGTDAAGADAWAAPDLVATGATVGAPPDPWNANGQNWGLPPLNAAALRARAFEPFAELLRDNMREAGALRIDHVLGLMRLFCIPEGGTPADGAYVAYPFDEMIGVVALESHRNRCLVIGEDLGTLPEGFQVAMRSAGLLSYCLLYFERDWSGRFKSPGEYPADALVSINTHDLPTLWGYWSGHDVEVKAELGLIPGADGADGLRRSRADERAGLIGALAQEGLLAHDHPADDVPLEAILRFMARTPCRMLMVGAEDLLGVREQANVPGTIDQHPNWRRRLPVDVATIAQDARVKAATEALRAERPAPWLAQDGS